MDNKIVKALIKRAIEASEKSYSPYSKYKVGSALLTNDEKIFTGANVENASYGLSVCAERIAIFKAVSEGYKILRQLRYIQKMVDFLAVHAYKF